MLLTILTVSSDCAALNYLFAIDGGSRYCPFYQQIDRFHYRPLFFRGRLRFGCLFSFFLQPLIRNANIWLAHIPATPRARSVAGTGLGQCVLILTVPLGECTYCQHPNSLSPIPHYSFWYISRLSRRNFNCGTFIHFILLFLALPYRAKSGKPG